MQIHAITTREELSTGEPVYVALAPELNIASQGRTPEEARDNLREAVELFLEVASPEEIERRRREGADVALLELAA